MYARIDAVISGSGWEQTQRMEGRPLCRPPWRKPKGFLHGSGVVSDPGAIEHMPVGSGQVCDRSFGPVSGLDERAKIRPAVGCQVGPGLDGIGPRSKCGVEHDVDLCIETRHVCYRQCETGRYVGRHCWLLRLSRCNSR